ncbi:hypothetical protein J14TS2_52200 [Bacillus sp. J14TS2]|nr:hypothetical protein J14TS2_52200 [Bacillus sp. J14TS2]
MGIGRRSCLLGLIVISVFNTITDPTVKEFSDSKQELRYIKPRNDKKYLKSPFLRISFSY